MARAEEHPATQQSVAATSDGCRDSAHIPRFSLCQKPFFLRNSIVKAKPSDRPLTSAALIKETCRRIRAARSLWDAHNNRACRGEREKALALYESLSKAEREKVPQTLRVWLRYRSEKYFGPDRTAPGAGR